VGDATGINREMSRREFLKKVGGATLAGVAKKALGPLPEAEKAAAALAPPKQPRFLSDSVVAGFKMPGNSEIMSVGPNTALWSGDTHLMSRADMDLLEKYTKQAAAVAHLAPENAVTYFNPLTNQWHEIVNKHYSTKEISDLFSQNDLPPGSMEPLVPYYQRKANGAYMDESGNWVVSEPFGNIDKPHAFSYEPYNQIHYLPANEKIDPRLLQNPWDTSSEEYLRTGKLPEVRPGTFHTEFMTEPYIANGHPENLVEAMGGIANGGQQFFWEKKYWDRNWRDIRNRLMRDKRPNAGFGEREKEKLLKQSNEALGYQETAGTDSAAGGVVLRPGEPQPSGMSYGPLGAILLDEPEPPTRRGKAFTRGIRNSLYGAGTAAVLSQLLDDNEEPKERY
jgi:hypothetical protein